MIHPIRTIREWFRRRAEKQLPPPPKVTPPDVKNAMKEHRDRAIVRLLELEADVDRASVGRG